MIKIAVLGPESTGKTELVEKLSDYYNAPWVPEYARQYVEQLGRSYTYEDVCEIALKQVEQEKYYLKDIHSHSDFVFFDTELIITKVWFEYKYKSVPTFLTEQLQAGFFDFYLLCAPDLIWKEDAVREHGSDREFFFEWYKKEIELTAKPFVIVSGFGEQRVLNAIAAISNFEKQQHSQ